uniref:Serpin family B member 1 n=1 Tax=Maylandia zebra TaxID=106582 RepID=A0A3P9CJX2_9CICH
MSAVSSSNTAFALELFRTLSQTNPAGNIFVSPLSIGAALATVYEGAKGDTAAQITQALSFSSGEGVHANFQKLNAEINSPSASYILKLANRLYGENIAHFLPDFIDVTHRNYLADPITVDFIGAPEACRAAINSWVEQQTESETVHLPQPEQQGIILASSVNYNEILLFRYFLSDKIKDLLKPGTVNKDTRLALVNAVYFKGNWKNPFKEANTKEMPFEIRQNETVPVQMMYQRKKLPYNYIADHDLQILELPYVGEELSMFILLPKESSDGSGPLLKLEKELTQERLNEWTDRKNMEVDLEVLVDLPKFKLEEDYELNEPLTKLGMKDVFCAGSADLSGMNGEGGLFLSTVAHKVFVEVNEEGTQAAAATGVVSRNLSSGWTRYFTADHPFLFFIRHNETKSVLFFGRFSSPQ